MSDLPFTPTERHYSALVLAVEDACKVLTFPVAAGAVSMRDGDLRAMLEGRNGRRLDTKVAAIIAERVGAGIYRDAIVRAIKELFGLFEPMNDREWAHKLEGVLLTFGTPGADALTKARQEARRV